MQDRAAKMQTAGARDATFLAPESCGRLTREHRDAGVRPTKEKLMPGPTSHLGGPTVVLVRGAFADAGSWAPVTQRLVSAGVPVMAIVNRLRGVKHDSAYVASVISQIFRTSVTTVYRLAAQ